MLSAAPMSPRTALVLCASLLTGCYAFHERSEDASSVSPDGAIARDAGRIEPADAHVPPWASCEALTASPARLLTHAPPNDFSLGSVQATSSTGALIAFTSSNDASEMDVSRWVLPIDLLTGAPRADDRIVVFGPPSGSTYSAHSRVVVGPRSTLAFTWSSGQGCLRRRLDADGRFLGPERRDDGGPCLSARVSAGGDIVFLRRDADEGVYYFETVDDEGAFVSATSLGRSARELSASDRVTWAFAADGSTALLALDVADPGMRFATWRTERLAWRRVEGAGHGTSLRMIAVGERLLGAWYSLDGVIELAYFDDAILHTTALRGVASAGFDLAYRDGEIWVALAIGETHADARTTIARLDLALEERAPRTEVGDASFVSALRLLPTSAGALLVQQGQRADAAGGTNLFAGAITCTAAGTRPRGCAAWAASVDRCASACPEPPRFVWDGARCEAITCDCVGPDCVHAYDTLEACLSEHRDCPSVRCEATGGAWLRPNRRYCMAPVCGDDPSPCDDPPDVICHCGLTALYDPRVGCVPGFCAGRESTDQLRCERSGGTWGTFCTHSHCGEAPDPCVDPACRCTPDEVWSAVAGCVASDACAPLTCGGG